MGVGNLATVRKGPVKASVDAVIAISTRNSFGAGWGAGLGSGCAFDCAAATGLLLLLRLMHVVPGGATAALTRGSYHSSVPQAAKMKHTCAGQSGKWKGTQLQIGLAKSCYMASAEASACGVPAS
jgi:hypothetical protein